jgi:hypothetical protein
MKTIRFLIIALAFSLAGCATPTVVKTTQINDTELSCNALIAATEEAKKFEESARDERTVTGTNVGAAIFFWPGLIATYMNTDDAIDAARDRQAHLDKLYKKKGCSGSSDTNAGNGTVAGNLQRLKKMHSDGLISDEEYTAARKKALGLQ